MPSFHQLKVSQYLWSQSWLTVLPYPHWMASCSKETRWKILCHPAGSGGQAIEWTKFLKKPWGALVYCMCLSNKII